ncbi:uncharacterized protein LOC122062594 [Macadamia integrifolia]|uniref:uncharacterized protein LOC122062594 n=1 Tax=Macadamia integrifolia TaxID=60698 RepID=UPI001C4E66D7|nr:uncharacterized protein LOC122062594 [Macadamia integrifolia]
MRGMISLRLFQLVHSGIVTIPDDFSVLSSLEVLSLGIPGRRGYREEELDQTLAISMDGFSQLRELYLIDYMSIESLPELPSTLTRLHIDHCSSLKMISDLSHLEWLEELLLYTCQGLQYLPNLPSNLTRLNCCSCKSLVRLPDFSNLKKLRELFFGNCENIEEMHGLQGTESLEDLNLPGCYRITETMRKMHGQGRLLHDAEDGQGSNSISDDEIYNGSPPSWYPQWFNVYHLCASWWSNKVQGMVVEMKRPILCVVLAFPLWKEMNEFGFQDGELVTITLQIEASIRWGEKRTLCGHCIRIEDIEFTKRDIVYIHHLKGFDWFGFPLESKDAMEELHVKVSGVYRQSESRDYDDWICEVKCSKLLFEDKESNQQIPIQQSSAKLVAGFFKWSEAADDDIEDHSVERDEGRLLQLRVRWIYKVHEKRFRENSLCTQHCMKPRLYRLDGYHDPILIDPRADDRATQLGSELLPD